ncbi:hypothetical protein [Azospirillum formosense]|nr:hypothetical protein [Azospirillum formosense]
MNDPKVQNTPASADDVAFFQEIEGLQGKRPMLVLPEGLTAEDVVALSMIAAERARQITAKGFTPAHDDAQGPSNLEMAGGEYLVHAGSGEVNRQLFSPGHPSAEWPWPSEFWKPKSPMRDGVKGCALGVAGIAARLRRGEPVEG